ncbi:glycosyltransferase [Marinoscillum sp. MHG1-6]|uniref:glycosyltransferase n=1 Tax=Marinoscillum sp. MHG1-6 TaxID=2959627 RepID=UPI0021577E35|nr:glycosyltransferase [Marinoscillum sp. MHG1-6]
MKIAIIGSRGYPYVYSGYETFVKETFELLKEKHEIHVYAHRHLYTERPKEVNGIHIHYIPTVDTKALSQLSNSFLATLHALLFLRFDIILYVNTANGPFGLLTKLFRKRTAIITDGLEWQRPKWKGFGARYFYWASRLSTKVFDQLISDSEEMRRIYLEEFNKDSVVIEYGAHLKESRQADRLESIGIIPREYYLIVGRLIPDNNADLIVEAFSKTSSKKKLVIVGDVPYEDEYARNIKSFASDKIIFTGYVKDQELLMELYSNAYIYVHGHEYGGTNPTLLKALAYGCCILALDTPFSREVLLDDKHGFYFQKKIQSIVDQVAFLDNQEGMIEEKRVISRSRITEKYTWERIAQEYDHLFKGLVNN